MLEIYEQWIIFAIIIDLFVTREILCMFVKDMYLSVFYCLCYDTDISTDISEEQVVQERDPDLNEMEDIRFDEIREDHWRDLAKENDDNKKIHALIWNVYVTDK